MVKKNYDWDGGATLDDHTKKKHTILREYFRQYLITRCKIPKRKKLRLIIVDGFPWQVVPKAILNRVNV